MALATAAGIDARTALVADRTDIVFSPKTMMDRYFLDDRAIAMKEGDAWKFVNVSQKLVAPGSLPWREEGVYALITDPKDPEFVTTAIAPASASQDKRVGHFHLSADGALEGNVQEEYTGHRAEEYRAELYNQSQAQQEEWFNNRLSRMFPESQVTNLKIENAADPKQPLRAEYHLVAPGYAQRTGKRLLFQPNVFRRSQNTPFTSSDRTTLVEFPYAWKEVDQVEIQLPADFSIDNADNPGSFAFGAGGGYKLDMTYTKGTPMYFITRREFTFGDAGTLYIDPPNYPQLKKIFDAVRTRDTHSISLKVN
jgi:hypothetical protein